MAAPPRLIFQRSALLVASAPPCKISRECCDALARHVERGTGGQPEYPCPGSVVEDVEVVADNVLDVLVDVLVVDAGDVEDDVLVLVDGGGGTVELVVVELVVVVVELLVEVELLDVELVVDDDVLVLVDGGGGTVELVVVELVVVVVELLVEVELLDVELVVDDDVLVLVDGGGGTVELVVVELVVVVVELLVEVELLDVELVVDDDVLVLVDGGGGTVELVVVDVDVVLEVLVELVVDEDVLVDVELVVEVVLLVVVVDPVSAPHPRSVMRWRASDAACNGPVYIGSINSFGAHVVLQCETDETPSTGFGAYISTWPLPTSRPVVRMPLFATTALPVQWRSPVSFAEAARCASVIAGHPRPVLWSSRCFM